MKFILPKDNPAALLTNFRSVPCPNGCNTSENKMRLRNVSQISGTQANWRISGIKFPTPILQHMDDLVSLVYADEPAGFWYLHGPNGSGKTYALVAAVNEAINQQRSGVYIKSPDLINLLRQSISSDSVHRSEPQLLRQIKATTVLAIDEIGRERSTEYAKEKLFEIIDERYRAAHMYDSGYPAKLTILAGNYPTDQIEPYLASRLRDRNSRVVDFSKLPDRRKDKK